MNTSKQANDSTVKDQGLRYLNFSLDQEEYAIPLLAVREVIAMPDITPIPFSPNYFLGIMNLRGQVISIIDFRKKIGVKAKTDQETAVIICDLDGTSIGVVVDSINRVIAPGESELSDKPQAIAAKNSDYIIKVYKRQNELVLLIDIAKALGMEDLMLASKSTSNAA